MLPLENPIDTGLLEQFIEYIQYIRMYMAELDGTPQDKHSLLPIIYSGRSGAEV